MQAKLEKALGKAIHFLEKRKIPYAIIGGLALSQWGFDRFTDDIDFKIFVQDSDEILKLLFYPIISLSIFVPLRYLQITQKAGNFSLISLLKQEYLHGNDF